MTDTLIIEEVSPLDLLKDQVHEEGYLHDDIAAKRKEIGKTLSQLRKERKLSFRKAATLLKVDPGLLNRVEKGKAWAYTVVHKALEVYPTIPV